MNGGTGVSLEAEIHAFKLTVEELRHRMALRDARYESTIERLTFRLETEMPIRERLASLEARIGSNSSLSK